MAMTSETFFMTQTNTNPIILAVGAGGPFAGLVVPALAKRGAKVRGLIRDAAQSDAVLKNGAAQIAIGDLTDATSVRAALQGVSSVFYIAPAFMKDEAQVGQNFVAAAKAAGVRRFVFSSVVDPILGALVNHAAKAPVEEAILESGMEYVFLQPVMFLQNLAAAWAGVQKSGVFAQPWSNDTRFSYVDYREVAEVAAIALLEDRLLFGTFELCSQGQFNRYDTAALMSEVLGEKIEARKLSFDKPPTDKPPAGDPGQAAARKVMMDWYDHHGLMGNALTLRAILGREPKTLRSFLEELATSPK